MSWLLTVFLHFFLRFFFAFLDNSINDDVISFVLKTPTLIMGIGALVVVTHGALVVTHGALVVVTPDAQCCCDQG